MYKILSQCCQLNIHQNAPQAPPKIVVHRSQVAQFSVSPLNFTLTVMVQQTATPDLLPAAQGSKVAQICGLAVVWATLFSLSMHHQIAFCHIQPHSATNPILLSLMSDFNTAWGN